MNGRHLSTLIAPALISAAVAASSLAQEAGYRLDESGRWVQVSAPEPGSAEALLLEARRHLAEERPAEARKLLAPWIREHERTSHPLLPQAYLLRGDALTAMGDEYKALYDYEAVIKNFPGSEEFLTANERELDIAVRYVNGLNRKLFGLRWADATGEGEELLIRVQERLPGSRLAERAGIELADYYFRTRDLKLASDAYDLFLKNYPNSPYVMKAMQRRVYSAIGRFKGPRYDGAPLINAQVLIRRFAGLYPAEAEQAGLDETLLIRLDEAAGAELLETGRWYLRNGDPAAARLTLRRLVREHPRTAAAMRALEILESHGWASPGELTPTGPSRRVLPRSPATPPDGAPAQEPLLPAEPRTAPETPPPPPPPATPPAVSPDATPASPREPDRPGLPRLVPGTPLRPPASGDSSGGEPTPQNGGGR